MTMAAPTDRPRPADGAGLLRGFAPLVVAAIVALLVVLLVPSVAPEHIVSVPAGGSGATASTTAGVTSTTSAPAAPAETTVVP